MTVTSIDIANAVNVALNPSGIGSFEIGNSPVGGWPTVAQNRVFLPRDWPIQQQDIPVIKIGPPQETKVAQGRAGIGFNTTTSLEVIAEVSSDGLDDNAAAGLVLAALALIQRDIELAVINNEILFGGDRPGLVQQLERLTTKTATNAEGTKARGALSMTFEFSFYQGAEDFRLPDYQEIDRFHIYADLINVADPAGTYIPPMNYTPTPAPRTQGPDGRIEGQFEVPVSAPEA